MALKRFSRGAPAQLTVDEQDALVKAADADPELRRNLETLLGVSWDNLNFGQKLTAVANYLQTGYIALTVAAAAEGQRKLALLAEEQRGEIPAADQAALLKEQNRLLLERNKQIREELTKTRQHLTALQAEPAAAVHSKTTGDH